LDEIKYKLYIELTDESGIIESCNYFSKNNDKALLMRSLFIKAVVQSNNGYLNKSIISAFESKEIANELNNLEYQAKTNEVISDIYNLSYNAQEELKYVTAAAIYYKKANKETNHICSTIDRAIAYWNNGHYKECNRLIDSIIPHISKGDTAILAYAYENKIRALISQGKGREAKETQYLLMSSVGKQYPIDISIPLDVAIANDDEEDARSLVETIVDDSVDKSPKILSSLCNYYKKNGDYEKALLYYEELMNVQNKAVKHTFNEGVVQTLRDYFADKALSSKLHMVKLRLWWSLSLIIAAVVILILIMYHRSRIRRKIEDAENKIEEIRDLSYTIRTKDLSIHSLTERVEQDENQLLELSREVDHKQNLISRMEDEVNKLYKAQFNTLNELCREFFEKKDASEKVRMSLYKEVESQILKLKDRNNLRELENSLNTYNNGIVSKLRESFPNMKPIDRTFLILTFAGLSSKAICIICDLTIGNYYNKRQRLKQKIEGSDSPYKSLFVTNMR